MGTGGAFDGLDPLAIGVVEAVEPYAIDTLAVDAQSARGVPFPCPLTRPNSYGGGLMRSMLQPPEVSPLVLIPTVSLTRHEQAVLELVALGLSSRQVGELLWISRQAVTYHIGNLLSKFAAQSRTGLVARAYAVGVLEPGDWPPRLNDGSASEAHPSRRTVVRHLNVAP